MKFTVKNVDFSKELNLLERIVGRKPTISVLANVLIRAAENALVLTATDLEVGLVGACAAEVEEPGVVTLPAKKLVELVRAQSGNTIQISDDKRGSVKFVSGGFTSKLQSLPAADFPAIPPIEGESMMWPRAHLRETINQVRFAINDNDSRYYTKGACIAFSDNLMTMVATDSSRLAVSKLTREGGPADAVLVPAKALEELSTLLGEQGDGEISFTRSERHIFFDFDGRLFISRQVDGKFPAYERIIPKGYPHEAKVARLPLIAVLKRMVLIDNVVQLLLTENALDVRSANAEIGEGAETVPTLYQGPSFDLRFNGQYVLDFLEAAVSEQVVLSLKDASLPVLFVDGNYLNVIMGMHT